MKRFRGFLIINLVAIIAYMFTVNDNQYKDYQDHINKQNKMIEQLRTEKKKLQEQRLQSRDIEIVESEEEI